MSTDIWTGCLTPVSQHVCCNFITHQNDNFVRESISHSHASPVKVSACCPARLAGAPSCNDSRQNKCLFPARQTPQYTETNLLGSAQPEQPAQNNGTPQAPFFSYDQCCVPLRCKAAQAPVHRPMHTPPCTWHRLQHRPGPKRDVAQLTGSKTLCAPCACLQCTQTCPVLEPVPAEACLCCNLLHLLLGAPQLMSDHWPAPPAPCASSTCSAV